MKELILTQYQQIDREVLLQGGLYRVTTKAERIEIELVSEPLLARSVLYPEASHTIFVRLPQSAYRFFVRPLGQDVDKNTVHFKKLNPWETLNFYINKGLGLLTSSASGRQRLLQAIAARFKASGQQSVEGYSLRNAQAMVPTISEPRVEMVAGTAPQDLKRVSIIIPTKEKVDLLTACINSLDRIKDCQIEIIIVDNGAVNPAMTSYLASLATRPNTTVLRRDIPFNFSQLCNDGARLAQFPLLLFLNDDVEAFDDVWLGRMVDYMALPDTGVVGARLLYPSGDLQHGGIAANLVPGPGHPWRGAPEDIWTQHPLLATAGEVDAVTGACLLIRRDVFESVGGFDESVFKITLNDVDLCLKVRLKGLRILYVPQATLIHKEGQTRRADDAPQEIQRRSEELKSFFLKYPEFSRTSCFYPETLRRDTDQALMI